MRRQTHLVPPTVQTKSVSVAQWIPFNIAVGVDATIEAYRVRLDIPPSRLVLRNQVLEKHVGQHSDNRDGGDDVKYPRDNKHRITRAHKTQTK